MKNPTDNTSRFDSLLQSVAEGEKTSGDRAISRAMARVRQESPYPAKSERIALLLRPLRQASLVAAMALVIGTGIIGWNLLPKSVPDSQEVAPISAAQVAASQAINTRYVLREVDSPDPTSGLSFSSLPEAISNVKNQGTILVGPGEIRGPIRIDKSLTLAALDTSAEGVPQDG